MEKARPLFADAPSGILFFCLVLAAAFFVLPGDGNLDS